MLKNKLTKILLGISCAMMLLTATAITEAAPPQEEKPNFPKHKIEHRLKNHEHRWKGHKFHKHHHKHYHHHHGHHHEWKKCCRCK